MKTGAPPCPARYTYIKNRHATSQEVGNGQARSDACPSQAIFGVFKKGEKILEPQKK